MASTTTTKKTVDLKSFAAKKVNTRNHCASCQREYEDQEARAVINVDAFARTYDPVEGKDQPELTTHKLSRIAATVCAACFSELWSQFEQIMPTEPSRTL